MEAQRATGVGGLMRYEITTDSGTRQVEVDRLPSGKFRVAVDGAAHEADLHRPTPESFHLLLDGASWEAGCVPAEGGYLVDVMGLTTFVGVEDPRRKSLRHAGRAASGVLVSQMPGRIVRLLVSTGDPVTKGQPMMVIEAMKMENELKAPVGGFVAEVYVSEGSAVEAGAKLARVDP